MEFESILFANNKTSNELSKSLPLFIDLQLNSVFDYIVDKNDHSNTLSYFYQPLDNLKLINYRQAIFNDLKNPHVFMAISTIYKQLRDIDEQYTQIKKSADSNHVASTHLFLLKSYLSIIDNFLNSNIIDSCQSEGLKCFERYLHQIMASEIMLKLKQRIQEVELALSEININFAIKDKVIEAYLANNPSDYYSRLNQCLSRLELFPSKSNLSSNHDSRLFKAGIIHYDLIQLVEKLFPDTFSQLKCLSQDNLNFFDSKLLLFTKEFGFYLSYHNFMMKLKSPFTVPSLNSIDKQEKVIGNYDINLAISMMDSNRETVKNDYQLDEQQRIIFISGPNQGGKTTFAKAIGQIHYLSKLGVPVPATSASLYLVDQVLTHFERDEVITTADGKLQDDINRLFQIDQLMTNRSLLIINEIYSSTTLVDATLLSEKLLTKIIEKGSLAVNVSFIYRLSQFSPAITSMVSQLDNSNPNRRTFKIIAEHYSQDALALNLAAQYQLTTTEIINTIKNKGIVS
ncbi:hypothetical protein L0B53_13940 [Vibrio sp. SS-MA-C1-2]|uniref:MutS-related protein n=1 Tax=Vibrio sp. SS-MA-C1-2 TaxID=2908646 RepID=UPI001F26C23E|nr:hypothetical protein [Vibrio sp. SS-MA-C1-2]UJF18114.1 hypothetical protein L0B53_13940 [Vibrio sp. SS-MA-C1-2]